MSDVATSLVKYFRESPLTADKRAWIRAQIDGLLEANHKMRIQAEMIEVHIACNERQAREMERVLAQSS